MIEIKEVTKIYKPDTIALNDISFSVEEKEFVVVAGRSGAGKTTLLRLILAEESPTEGEVVIDGTDINKLPRRELPVLRRKIGAIFQDYKLLPSRTVYENICFVLNVIGAEDEEIERSVPEVLDIVGLRDKACNFPEQLSAGEKQRVAIARALIHRPNILLADEPTGNLDAANTKEVIDLLRKINEFGTTIILATHDRNIIKELRVRTILIKNGELDMEADKGKVLL